MTKKKNEKNIFLVKTSNKNYIINLAISLLLAILLSFILRIKYKSISALIFNFLIFFGLGYRAIEILITHKSIPLARLVYGRYREGRFAVVDFISYLVVIILYFTYNLLK